MTEQDYIIETGNARPPQQPNDQEALAAAATRLDALGLHLVATKTSDPTKVATDERTGRDSLLCKHYIGKGWVERRQPIKAVVGRIKSKEKCGLSARPFGPFSQLALLVLDYDAKGGVSLERAAEEVRRVSNDYCVIHSSTSPGHAQFWLRVHPTGAPTQGAWVIDDKVVGEFYCECDRHIYLHGALNAAGLADWLDRKPEMTDHRTLDIRPMRDRPSAVAAKSDSYGDEPCPWRVEQAVLDLCELHGLVCRKDADGQLSIGRKQGSIKVDPRRGLVNEFDVSSGFQGGRLPDLVMEVRGCDIAAAMEWLDGYKVSPLDEHEEIVVPGDRLLNDDVKDEADAREREQDEAEARAADDRHDTEFDEWSPSNSALIALSQTHPPVEIECGSPSPTALNDPWHFYTTGEIDHNGKPKRIRYLSNETEVVQARAESLYRKAELRRGDIPDIELRHTGRQFINKTDKAGGRPLSWAVWRQGRWMPIRKVAATESIAQFVKQYLKIVVENKRDPSKTEIKDDKRRAGSKVFLGNVVEMMEGFAPWDTMSSSWDRDPMLLGFGVRSTLDLRTQQVADRRPQDLITKEIRATFNEEVATMTEDELVKKFAVFQLLQAMFPNRQTRRAFLHLLAGGLVSGEWSGLLVLLDGIGRTGKTTITRAWARMLGDYGKEGLPTGFITVGGQGGKRGSDTFTAGNAAAEMNGVRGAIFADIGRDQVIDSERVKVMSGSARRDERRTKSEGNISVLYEAVVIAPFNGGLTIDHYDDSSGARIWNFRVADEARDVPLATKREAENEENINALFSHLVPLARRIVAAGTYPPKPPEVVALDRELAIKASPVFAALEEVAVPERMGMLPVDDVIEPLSRQLGRRLSNSDAIDELRKAQIKISKRAVVITPGDRRRAIYDWTPRKSG